jgi:hypothetical protein
VGSRPSARPPSIVARQVEMASGSTVDTCYVLGQYVAHWQQSPTNKALARIHQTQVLVYRI